jgi:RNA polymerase-interacting CarD/CdnL/TRCF family regulator
VRGRQPLAPIASGGIESLEIGARVFHPAHGVVSVLGKENRQFGSSVESFYVLGLPLGGRLLVPASTLPNTGVRDLVTSTRARELLAEVGTAEEAGALLSQKERAAVYSEALRSGDPERNTKILRELLSRAREAKLSMQDQQILDRSRSRFVAEIAAVLDRPGAEIEAALSPEPTGSARKA